MPEQDQNIASPSTRLAPHPLAITEMTRTAALTVEICRKTPVGVVSVIAANSDEGKYAVNVLRLSGLPRKLFRQGSSAW